jgi:hypothetical protein
MFAKRAFTGERSDRGSGQFDPDANEQAKRIGSGRHLSPHDFGYALQTRAVGFCLQLIVREERHSRWQALGRKRMGNSVGRAVEQISR